MMNGLLPNSSITPGQYQGTKVQLTHEIPSSTGYLFIDSETISKTQNISDGTAFTTSNRSLLGKQVSMYSADSIRINFNSYNVNPRNNTVEFISSNTGATVHSVTIVPGKYLTATTLMDALVTALNTATGASGLTFSHLANPDVGGTIYNDAKAFRLQSAGGSYYFTLNDTHTCMQKGKYLYNLPRTQTLQTSKNVGRVLGFYSRWVDFVSNELTESTRIPATSSGNTSVNNILFTIYISNLELVNSAPGIIQIETQRWLLKELSKSIAIADIRLIDEFGEPYYFPKFDDDTDINDWYNILFSTR